MKADIKITGGAGPLEAAAIAAVVQQVLTEEAPAENRHRRNVQDRWVLALRGDLEPGPKLRR